LACLGTVFNSLQTKEMIKPQIRDILILDVEMNGLAFLEKQMRLHPMSVLMISSLTKKGSEAALRALELGAIDFMVKPKLGLSTGMKEYAENVAYKIRAANIAKAILTMQPASPRKSQELSSDLGNQITSTEKSLFWARRPAVQRRSGNF
jgi:two-component system chemotaxis response regulator CheB